MPTTVMRRLRRSVLALSLATLAGCSMFSNHNPRYDPVELTEYPASVSANVLWSVSLGSGSGYGFARLVQGGSVYAAARSGNVMRIDGASGAVQWNASAGTGWPAGVGSAGTTTAVVANNGTVIACNAQGKEIWRTRASSAVYVPRA